MAKKAENAQIAAESVVTETVSETIQPAEKQITAFRHEMDWVKNDILIGELTFDFAGIVRVNGVELPENSVRFIMDWGFKQPLMNAYADNKKDAVKEWTRVLSNILAGKVSAEGRTRIDPVWAEMRTIVEPELLAALGYKNVGVARKANPDGAWIRLLDGAVKKHESIVRPTAEANVKARDIPLAAQLRASLIAGDTAE